MEKKILNNRVVRSFVDLPVAEFSKPGEAVYKYKYLDKTDGKLKDGERNMQQMISSSLAQCEYKKLYNEGERFNDDRECVYLDTAKYGNDFDSISNYFKGLADSIREKMQTSASSTVQQDVQQPTNQVSQVSEASRSNSEKGEQTGGNK